MNQWVYYRGSECFGGLVSAEAHGHDGGQVLLRQALRGRGSGRRATARQHQRGGEVCSQSKDRDMAMTNGYFGEQNRGS